MKTYCQFEIHDKTSNENEIKWICTDSECSKWRFGCNQCINTSHIDKNHQLLNIEDLTRRSAKIFQLKNKNLKDLFKLKKEMMYSIQKIESVFHEKMNQTEQNILDLINEQKLEFIDQNLKIAAKILKNKFSQLSTSEIETIFAHEVDTSEQIKIKQLKESYTITNRKFKQIEVILHTLSSKSVKKFFSDGRCLQYLYYIFKSYYQGNVENGKKQGFGKFVNKNGEVYQGGWNNDQCCGEGKKIFENGDIYIGQWYENKQNGLGMRKWQSNSWKGDFYYGEWKNDFISGNGIYFYANGDRYEGEVQENNKHGKGVYTKLSGYRYEGEFRNNLYQGKGKLYKENGDKYDGEFNNGQIDGKGIYQMNDGNCYNGEWKNDKLNGYGIFYYKNGERYEGQWLNNLKDGKGKYFYTNGDIYDGEWKQGRKEGKGSYVFQSGNKYEGEWLSGRSEGNGEFQWNQGGKYVGEWQNDQRQGIGKFYFLNGNIFEGLWDNGKRNGEGIIYLLNENRECGIYKNDKKVGKHKLLDKNKKLIRYFLILQFYQEQIIIRIIDFLYLLKQYKQKNFFNVFQHQEFQNQENQFKILFTRKKFRKLSWIYNHKYQIHILPSLFLIKWN